MANISGYKVLVTERIKSYIYKHYMDKTIMEDINRLVGYSANNCERIFKEVTGKTRSEYLADYRYFMITHLLVTTNWKFYEIIHFVGYDSPSCIGTRFKQRYGMNMRRYRIEHKESALWNSSFMQLATV